MTASGFRIVAILNSLVLKAKNNTGSAIKVDMAAIRKIFLLFRRTRHNATKKVIVVPAKVVRVPVDMRSPNEMIDSAR